MYLNDVHGHVRFLENLMGTQFIILNVVLFSVY